MLVSCIANRGADVPSIYFDGSYGIRTQHRNITTGRVYVVYASELLHSGLLFFYVCDDDFLWYPMRYPAPLFRIIDARESQYWQTNRNKNGDVLKAPSTWISNDSFYDRLVDMEADEVDEFNYMKKLIDQEVQPEI